MPFPPIYLILAGGLTLLTLLVFQVLVGRRIIKLGKNHFVIHKWTGYSMLALAAFHAGFAIYTFFPL
jgi:hypothetical protein